MQEDLISLYEVDFIIDQRLRCNAANTKIPATARSYVRKELIAVRKLLRIECTGSARRKAVRENYPYKK